MASNSLYCEARVLTPPGMAQGSSRPAGRVLTFAWSEAPQSMLLAVALDNATVILLNEHAEPYYEGAVLSTKSRVANARCLCWSPAASGSLMLAIGWEDGSVMVWADGPNANDRVAREDTDQHATHPVTFVLWSPDASRLISGDGRAVGAAPVPHSPPPPPPPAAAAACARPTLTAPHPRRRVTAQEAAVLAVWKVDSRGRHAMICPYKRAAAGALSHATFRTNVPVKKTVTSAFAAADCPPFYFGGETGAICFGDDMGHSNDAVAPLGAPLGATRCEANTAGVVRPGLPPQPDARPLGWQVPCSTMRRMTP